MKHQKLVPGQKNLLSFVLAVGNFTGNSRILSVWGLLMLLGSLATPPGVSAADLTRQLHQPNSIRNTPFTSPWMGREARDWADQRVRIAEEYLRANTPVKALDALLPALEVYHHQGDLRSQGLTYELMGRAYVALGRHKEAENAIRRRLGIARDTGDLRSQVFALNNIGTFLLQQGDADLAARDAFAEALQIANRIKSSEGQGLSWSNLGLAAARLGEYNKAIKFYETALTYRRQVRDPLGEANTYNNLGDAYFATGDYQNTIAAYGRALRLANASRDRINELRSIDGLVAAHVSVERYERAFELLAQRLNLAQQMQNLPEQLVSFESYARTYERLGKYQTARNFYERAAIIARNLQDSKKEVQLLDRITQIRHRRG